MWNFIKNLLFSKSPDMFLKRFLVFLAVLLIMMILWRKYGNNIISEGFTQKQPFVLKTDTDIYDEFYSEIYDELFRTDERVTHEIREIVKICQPVKSDNTVILDVGSGTGQIVNSLQNAGYNVHGIEKSDAMVKYSKNKYDTISIKHGCVLDPMSFEPSTFSHILSLYFTIYQFPNKSTFFTNCYTWLKPNGYLVLHLVDPNHFDAVIPAGRPSLIYNPQIYSDKRITNTEIIFRDFNYKATYNFDNTLVKFTETFKDNANGYVRQNEQTLYMSSVDDILKDARNHGFIAHGFATLDDNHQYIYVFEKIM